LLSLKNEFARLRLQGSCQSCPSSAVTLELAVRQAIEEFCPDLLGFEVEGASEMARQSYPRASWVSIEGATELAEGASIRTSAGGVPLLLCRFGGRPFAYRDRCPACNIPLHLGSLREGLLTCLEGHRFSVPDAGRSPDNPALHLEPFPLINEDGVMKVALAFQAPEPLSSAATL
jgi:nitrite reductase/ring-hydroxylating ferredoxin subunit